MSQWERYWRAGYTAQGSSDVLVTKYAKTREAASRTALDGAVADLARLAELGLDTPVTFWIEAWKTRRIEESEPREVVDTHQFPRRQEVVEL